MESKYDKVPSLNRLEQYIDLAKKLNDGPWIEHSLNVGEAAKRIASFHPELDENVAYVLGCLHDIGRIEGFSNMHHTISGYNYMIEEGYEFVARICLTHFFPLRDINCYSGKMDCTDEEMIFLHDYISEVDYNEYDRLIQLCDAVALPEGFCIIEKRLVDVTIRHGFNDLTIEKWQEFLKIADYFSNVINRSIYSVLQSDSINNYDLWVSK